MVTLARITVAAVLAAAVAVPTAAHAQREIVQPLPPKGSDRLSDALRRLARNAADVSALLDAGEAALDVGDIDAAIGFFGRAKQLSPTNSRISLGLGKAYARSRRPIEALRLFAEAERAGVTNDRMAEDRGMAFMLVGDNRSAQELFRLALAQGAGSEVKRRLALSLAISGERESFEQTLLPLLEARDLAAFRTRAFGLAILGDTREAIDISDAMLPAQMAGRVRPYLEFMPRLTPAQQAAAGTLGVFPRAANIGTDDPQIAAYVPVAPAPAASQTSATRPPAAAARQPQPTPQRRVAARQAENRAPARQRQERPRRTATVGPRSSENAGIAPDLSPATTRVAQQQAAPQPVAQQNPAPAQAAQSSRPAEEAPRTAANPAATAAVPEPADTAPVVIARQPAAAPISIEPVPATAAPLPPPPPPPPSEPAPTLEQAFAGFTLEPTTSRPAAQGAVDITRIEAPREKAEPDPPPPPAHPSRHWVQVATGKDVSALGFDWRRIARKADGLLDGKGPFVTPWGEANRLLSGPYPDAATAREMMNELKGLDIDSFTFRSAEGEAIEPLG
ncbi:tetratricopeptide repeat protein [Qipengyuania sp. G39]|uniref:Tetratricopeptide repeat protein n=1 Tax=Qipengyuania profundimaris TaxID=3067652 RepID=A0ABT9HN44_9SPHN|nr:tetratricopeptide repeat protein [Qipengyuania sp. G39]MDP4574574.1 tetratricopeptide repeat protein [Qipengyuania sp. G39]